MTNMNLASNRTTFEIMKYSESARAFVNNSKMISVTGSARNYEDGKNYIVYYDGLGTFEKAIEYKNNDQVVVLGVPEDEQKWSSKNLVKAINNGLKGIGAKEKLNPKYDFTQWRGTQVGVYACKQMQALTLVQSLLEKELNAFPVEEFDPDMIDTLPTYTQKRFDDKSMSIVYDEGRKTYYFDEKTIKYYHYLTTLIEANDIVPNGSDLMLNMLFGPPGTGKTEFSEVMAQALGMPYAYISLSSGFDTPDNFFFDLKMKDATMTWKERDFVELLMGDGDCVISIDEINRGPNPTILNSLLALFSGDFSLETNYGKITIGRGKKIIFLCANRGDEVQVHEIDPAMYQRGFTFNDFKKYNSMAEEAVYQRYIDLGVLSVTEKEVFKRTINAVRKYFDDNSISEAHVLTMRAFVSLLNKFVRTKDLSLTYEFGYLEAFRSVDEDHKKQIAEIIAREVL